MFKLIHSQSKVDRNSGEERREQYPKLEEQRTTES